MSLEAPSETSWAKDLAHRFGQLALAVVLGLSAVGCKDAQTFECMRGVAADVSGALDNITGNAARVSAEGDEAPPTVVVPPVPEVEPPGDPCEAGSLVITCVTK